MPPARGPNLTAVLAVAAVVEFALNRLVVRLFLPQLPTAAFARFLTEAGRFALHFGSVLGLFVLAGALFGAFKRYDLFPRSMRVATALIALFFTGIAAIGTVVMPLPERLTMHLTTSHAFLAWFLVMALWQTTGPMRPKLGTTLFALPAVFHGAALFAQRAGVSHPYPGHLVRAAEICALGAAALSPFLVGRQARTGLRRWAGPAAGGLALAVLVGALVVSFDFVRTLVLYGFGLDLTPPTSPAGVINMALVLSAFAGIATSIAWTLTSPGPMRLLGYGLVLLAAAGYQAVAPYQVVFSVCGLLAVACAVRCLAVPQPSVSQPSVPQAAA